MFVTPLVYQQTVNLHPIVTLTAVIVGSQLLGIVGAFWRFRWWRLAGPSSRRSSRERPHRGRTVRDPLAR